MDGLVELAGMLVELAVEAGGVSLSVLAAVGAIVGATVWAAEDPASPVRMVALLAVWIVIPVVFVTLLMRRGRKRDERPRR